MPAHGHASVRRGLLYRSTALNRLAGDDAVAFARLGIRSVFDLRTQAERTAEPDRLPPGTGYVVADVLGTSDGAPKQMMRLIANPGESVAVLGDGRGAALWAGQYRSFVSMESARAAYARLFADIASLEHRPALFHCSTGKDRTGWAAAAFLTFLGVPEALVMDDFLRSVTLLEPMTRPIYDGFAARGGDPNLLRQILDVRPAYLEAALAEVACRYGTIEDYFAEGLGLDRPTREALRDAFIERD